MSKQHVRNGRLGRLARQARAADTSKPPTQRFVGGVDKDKRWEKLS